ncbi:MAG: hypothetical protein JOZ72_05295 [Alphaproteobacteria bacterium]|nr:hypothetical protein [Alphaproteobacteria bacterium]
MDGEDEKLTFGTIWAVGAAALLSSVLSLAALLQRGSIGDGEQATIRIAVHLIVTCGIISTLMWAVLHFGFVRWVARYKTATFFLVVWGATVLINGAAIGVGFWWVKQNVAHADGEMAKANAELSTAFDANGAPRDMRVRSSGEAGEIVRLFKTQAAGEAGAAAAYRAALQALDYPAFMQPGRLAADRAFKQARSKLDKGRAALKTYRDAIAANDAAFRAGLAGSRMAQMLKEAVLRSYNARTVEAGERRTRQIAAETAIMAECGYELDDLSHAYGHWSGAGKKMSFTNRHDLDIFNDHLANLRAYAQNDR